MVPLTPSSFCLDRLVSLTALPPPPRRVVGKERRRRMRFLHLQSLTPSESGGWEAASLSSSSSPTNAEVAAADPARGLASLERETVRKCLCLHISTRDEP